MDTKEKKYALIGFKPDSYKMEFICLGYHNALDEEGAIAGLIMDDGIMKRFINDMKNNGYTTFFDIKDTKLSDDDVVKKIRKYYDPKTYLWKIDSSQYIHDNMSRVYEIVDINKIKIME